MKESQAVALPSLFISHGSPMTALEPREAGRFMQALGPAITATFGQPQAIVVLSAHTLTRTPVLLAGDRHEAVYDFGNFDDRLFTLRYDAPGAGPWAQRLSQALAVAQQPLEVVRASGLDHGIWTPLRYMFPEANIPVLPVGWPAHWSPQDLMRWGQALDPLRQDGVLVMGTGSLTHNLQRVFAGGLQNIDRPATTESTAFRQWFVQQSQQRAWASLVDYRQQAPYATLMHPTDEHLLPWFIAAGAGGSQYAPHRIHASLTYGDLAMDAYAFGEGAAPLAQALVH